jgi:hypothetical protein
VCQLYGIASGVLGYGVRCKQAYQGHERSPKCMMGPALGDMRQTTVAAHSLGPTAPA